ncbi:MAG: TonB family protein [Flavobacteriales bacterium]|jgi:TonB family protein
MNKPLNLTVILCLLGLCLLGSCSTQKIIHSENPDSSYTVIYIDGQIYRPQNRVNVVYPRSALIRGITGFCVIEFTVTTEGTTRNPSVISCSSNIFENNSLSAVGKFKYEPHTVRGSPVDIHNVQYKFSFGIEE